MFKSTDLADAVTLVAKGHELSRIARNGGQLLAFQFDTLTPEQALSILNSADASLCRAYHRALREVRKGMDAVMPRAGR